MGQLPSKDPRVRIEGPATPPSEMPMEPRQSLSWFYGLLLLLTFVALGTNLYLLYLVYEPQIKPLVSQLTEQVTQQLGQLKS